MQLIYVAETTGGLYTIKNAAFELDKQFTKSKSLIAFLLESIASIAAYAEKYAHSRASKHIVTEADLNINTKISGNQILWGLRENKSYMDMIESEKIQSMLENDLIKRLFLKLIETPEYDEYVLTNERIKKNESRILKFILSDILLQDEVFIALAEDFYSNWDDDAEIAQLLVYSVLDKPEKQDFNRIVSAEKWEFARDLLKTVIDKNDYLTEIIIPRLRNWEVDRIASVDMIFLKMAIAEFLYFETIPTKVTLNEYIDLAKEYSTPQSSAFINGLLDGVLKEFTQEKKIQKTAFVKFK